MKRILAFVSAVIFSVQSALAAAPAIPPSFYRPPNSGNYKQTRSFCFLGDSITYGNGATTIGYYDFVAQTIEMAGSGAVAYLGSGSIRSGHPGYRSDQIAPFLFSDCLSNSSVSDVVMLEGTNDSGQLYTVQQFAAQMLAQFKAVKAAGKSLWVMTIPPRGSNASPTAQQMLLIEQYNTWLRMVVPEYGTLIDIHKALVNTSNGNYYVGTYDSGDGVHPSNLGHRVIALQAVAALKAAGVTRACVIDDQSSLNLVSNGIFLSAQTGWFEQPGGTGTAPTYSLVADSSNFLCAGQWMQMDFAPGATSGSRIRAISLGNAGVSWSAGDVVALSLKVQINDVAGNWPTVGPGMAGTGSVRVGFADNTGTWVSATPYATLGIGYPAGTNLYNFGPSWLVFTLPATIANPLALWVSVSLPSGAELQVRVGDVAVINLTTSGLLSITQ